MANKEHGTLGETVPLLANQPHTKVYKRRWYILLIFSLVAMLQDTIWNTWGPVDQTAIFLYGWSSDLIALFANYGSILYIVAFIPVVYVLEQSLHTSMLFCTGFMAVGTILRCGFLQAPFISQEFFTVSCHICSVLNGISNIVVGSAPLAISAAWFPPEERVTATTIAQVFNGLGTGMSFLLASQIVRPLGANVSNVTDAEVHALEGDIQRYLYSNAVPAVVLFLLPLAYFPSAPPHPPSISSHQARLGFLSGFKEVLQSPAAWLVGVGCSIPQGTVIAWTAMMVVSLTRVCVGDTCLTQEWVNYLGIYATVASTVAAILVAVAADKFKGKLKEALMVLFSLATLVFFILSLISIGVFQFGNILYLKISVSLLLVIGNSLVVSSMPLAMELAMETCYPAAEGVVGGWISIWFNIASVVFLSLFGIPGIGTSWLDYVLPLSCVLAIPFMWNTRVEYRRMRVDMIAGENEGHFQHA